MQLHYIAKMFILILIMLFTATGILIKLNVSLLLTFFVVFFHVM